MKHRLWAAAVCAVWACNGGGTHLAGDAPPGVSGDAMVDAAGSGSGSGSGSGGLPNNGPPLGSCKGDWCWVYPLPDGNSLFGLWGSSASDIWLFGSNSTMLHYNGSAFTEVTIPTLDVSAGMVWGSAANDVWVSAGLHWDGTTWSTTDRSGGLVGGSAANDVWMLGTSAGLSHWNGATWTDIQAPAGFGPIAVGASPTILVSAAGGIAQWLGTNWGIADAGTHAANAATVIDSTHVVLAQDNGQVSFWDTGTWTTRTTPIAATWQAVAARSSTDVWVSGQFQGNSVRYHWDGAMWTAAPETNFVLSGEMWLDPTGLPWIVGGFGATVHAWNGAMWVSKRPDPTLRTVWGTAEDDLWTIGDTSTHPLHDALHWDGSAWSSIAFPYDSSYYPLGMWGSASNNIWIAAGQQNNFDTIDPLMLHWDGANWTTIAGFPSVDGIAEPAGFKAVGGSSASDVYAVGRHGVYHYDGANWTVLAAVPGGNDVFGIAANDFYIIQDSTLWHWNGVTWSSKTAPSSMFHGWQGAANDIWLSTSAGTYHYDGTFFVMMDNANGIDPIAGSSTNVFVGTTQWTAGTGHALSTPPFRDDSSWIAPDGHVFVAGAGLIVH